MKPTERFSSRVDNYAKYRPTYPKELLHLLEEETGLTPQWVIADIGSGTGISTIPLLANGNTVYGVEPNRPMRERAEALLRTYSHFISVDGTAEQTGLGMASVDLVVASQAFHWFDPEAAKKEFRRILGRGTGVGSAATPGHEEPRGYVALIWNERQVETPMEQAYESFILQYAIDYATVNHKNIPEEKIGAFFDPQPFHLRIAGNEQVFDWDGLKGRVLSSSYMPDEQNSIYEKMLVDLKAIFESYQEGGRVRVNYLTKGYVGKM